MSLDPIRKAMETFLGPAKATVALRHKGASAGVPTQIDVLLIEPPPDEDADEPFTYLATVGMSAVAMSGPIEHAELVLRVDGKHTKKNLEKLARKLGDVAVAPFREGFGLIDGMILDDVELPLFDGMPSALITGWGGPGGTECLPGLRPPVRVLEPTPLFPREAETVRKIGVEEAFRRFAAEGIETNDPGRDEARLTGRAATEDGDDDADESEVDDAPYDPDLEVRPVEELWDDIEAWLGANAPKVAAALRPGAAEERIRRFQGTVGVSCSDEYRASIARHDGAAYLTSYQYLPLDQAERIWKMQMELLNEGAFEGKEPSDASGRIFEAVWWNPAWLPVAADGGGNLLCIDMSPGTDGVWGQVIAWERGEGPLASRFPSFAAWLQGYLEDLETGAYVVSSDGEIENA